MHPLMLREVIKSCRERIAQGDCPTTPPFTVEQLEEAIAELAAQEREIAELRADYARESEALTQAIEQVAAERARAEAAEAECALLRQDAERYRWLRNSDEANMAAAWFLPTDAPMTGSPEEIDAAIDRAIAEGKHEA